MRVLYLAGWGRSGSTLLAAIMGQFPGAFAAGELRSLWARGMLEGRLCGCRKPVPACPVWEDVISGAAFSLTAEEMADVQVTSLRTRDYPPAWLRLAARRGIGERLERYVATYAAAYRAVEAATGADVVIDSSGYPLDALYLARYTDAEFYVLHLVRDPRPVAAAWASPKALDDTVDGSDSTFRQFSPAGSSAIWSLWNAVIDGPLGSAVGRDRVLRLRYEDFIADPEAAVGRVARFVGLDPATSPVDGRVATLAPSHLVAGNPSRFATGPVEITRRPETELSARDAVLATAPALPLLRRYGYPVRRRPAA
ncbi:MAG: sulfotransferase [Actinomycetota bacterium]